MNNTEIREACAALAEAIENNDTAASKALAVDLFANFLCDINNIAYGLQQLEMTARNR